MMMMQAIKQIKLIDWRVMNIVGWIANVTQGIKGIPWSIEANTHRQISIYDYNISYTLLIFYLRYFNIPI